MPRLFYFKNAGLSRKALLDDSMLKSELRFEYPEDLIATKPQYPPRIMRVGADSGPQEISMSSVSELFSAGDILVLNNTKVLKRRVFAPADLNKVPAEIEILFLSKNLDGTWDVLFPSRGMKLGDHLILPAGVVLELTQKGRPQKVRLNWDRCDLTEDQFFATHAELPLPPYIQRARSSRHTVHEDESWYQSQFAKIPGSCAAPTASIHFTLNDLAVIAARGVKIVELTLHVGLGTFLPVVTEDLNEHLMHSEYVEIPELSWIEIQKTKQKGGRVWALGTTVARSLESAALNKFVWTYPPPRHLSTDQVIEPSGDDKPSLSGWTDLLIQPGFLFRVVDGLLTNFHQPESTLLALVSAFMGQQKVQESYKWAVQKKFRLFSYGDLTIWTK